MRVRRFICSMSPLEQVLEAQRLARGVRGARAARAADLVLHAVGQHLDRRAHRCARRAVRVPSPDRRAACCGGVSAVHSSDSPLGGSSSPLSSSSRARTMRWRSVGSIVSAAHGARRARTACSAAGPRASSSAIQRSRTPSAGTGRRLSSVSAARRYRPVPPTTIGRRPAASRPSISAWASSAYWPALNVALTGRKREQAVLELSALARAGRAGERLEPDVDLQGVGGDRHRGLPHLAQPLGERDRDVGLADAGRSEQGDDLGRSHGRQYRAAMTADAGASR